MKTFRLGMIVVIAALMPGCMTGPDYKKPNVSVPEKWSEPLEGGAKDGPAQLAQWWKFFGDSTLDALIARAIQSNFDLRTAEARIREARASQRMTEAGLWPQLNASGSYTRTESKKAPSATGNANSVTISPLGVSVTGTQTGPSGLTIMENRNLSAGGGSSLTITSPQSSSAPKRQNDLFQAGFDATWELDVFGGTRREKEAAKASTEAAEENRRDVLVTLAAEVARNYFGLRSSQDVLEIVNANIRLQKETLELVRARFQAGLTNELDVKTAEAQLATTQSSAPALETSIRYSIHRLGVLLGREPGALLEELTPRALLPAVPAGIPVGIPSDLLRRRPDVRRAERELAGATARIGVATADLFPKFSLTGSLTRQGNALDGLNLGANQMWSIGPGIMWPVFDAGRIRANIRVQNARQEQALASYEKAVMTSLEDVENALVAFAKEQTRLASLSEAVDANRQALDIANELYKKGIVSFLSVLDAERTLFAAEQQRTQSKAAILTDLVSLYKALGGGWEEGSQEPDRAAGSRK
jgi:NodT family efflux transporter outer membrane factor (OMF) lipoprotein